VTAWWEALYDDLLADAMLVRDDDGDVEQTVDFLITHLGLWPGARVFDQCCGIGSLAIPLARRGFPVVGLDQAKHYIERASKDAKARRASARFVAGDAREVVPLRDADGAFNWWTSFGYGDDDADNARMLARAFEALAPGRWFALDTMNLASVLRGFQRDVVIRRPTPRGEVLLWRRSEIDLVRGRMDKKWHYRLPDGRVVEHASSLRLYLPDAVAALLRQVGFGEVRLLGGLDGAPVSLDSPRLIALARRPP
jgi:SAM-dependent methyltransferase